VVQRVTVYRNYYRDGQAGQTVSHPPGIDPGPALVRRTGGKLRGQWFPPPGKSRPGPGYYQDTDLVFLADPLAGMAYFFGEANVDLITLVRPVQGQSRDRTVAPVYNKLVRNGNFSDSRYG
jgi:hypothetical protein